VRKRSDAILNGLIAFVHDKLGLSPNQISLVGFVVGILAAGLVVSGYLEAGLGAMAVSQIVDGLDGGVARRYGLVSEKGKLLETVFDRLNELMIFFALAIVGLASYRMAILAVVAVLLITIVEPLSLFDPGFKRFMLYFGYLAAVVFHIRGFELAMHVIFWANLTGFIIGTIMVDYRLQKEIDAQVLIRRKAEHGLGIPALPADPPSFLSRVLA